MCVIPAYAFRSLPRRRQVSVRYDHKRRNAITSHDLWLAAKCPLKHLVTAYFSVFQCPCCHLFLLAYLPCLSTPHIIAEAPMNRKRKGSLALLSGATNDLCKKTANRPHLSIAHILAYMCMRWRATTKLGWAANRAGAIGCAAFHLRLKADCYAKSRLIGCHVSSAFAGWPAPQPALRAFAAPPRHENRLRGSRKRLRYAKAARKQRGTLSRLAVGIPIDNALQRFRDMPHRTYAGGCATPQPCQQSPTIPFSVFSCASTSPAFVVARSAKHAIMPLQRQLPLHKYLVAPSAPPEVNARYPCV
jgi:hypothetical protein